MATHLTKRLQNISGKNLTAIFSKIAKIDEFKGKSPENTYGISEADFKPPA